MAKFSDRVLAKLARKRIERYEVELDLADPERGPEPLRARGSDRMIYSRRVGSRVLLVFVEPYDHEEVVTAYYAPPPRKETKEKCLTTHM